MQFGKARDQLAVLLCGVRAGGGGESDGGVTQVLSLAAPSLEGVRRFHALALPRGADRCDATQAVTEAVSLLEPIKATKLMEKRVVLVLDRTAAAELDGDGLAILASAHATRVDVVLVGSEDATTSTDPAVHLTNALGGLLLSGEDALRELLELRAARSSPVPAFRGDLVIGDLVRIPVYTYKVMAKASAPSLKKRSRVGHVSGDVSMDRTYRLEDPPHDEVAEEDRAVVFQFGRDLIPASSADREAMRLAAVAELSVLGFVDVSAIRERWLIGGTYAVAPAQPAKTGQYKDLPLTCGVSALARALAESRRVAIARHVRRANSDPQLVVLYPYLGGNAAATAGDGTVSATADEDDGGEGADMAVPGVDDPVLGAHDMLVMISLPFAEDFREYAFPDLEQDARVVQARSSPHDSAAAALIDALDSSSSATAGDAHAPAVRDSPWFASPLAQPSFVPHTFPNPVIARVRAFALARALDPDAAIPPVDVRLAPIVYPSAPPLAARAAERFQEVFGLVRIEREQRKRKRFWGDDLPAAGAAPLDEVEAEDSAATSAAAKRGRDAITISASSGGAGHDAIGALAIDAVLRGTAGTRVGAVDPVGDFEALISRRDADFVRIAVTDMISQITRLIPDETMHEKAMRCLRSLRAGCVENFEEAAFNGFLGQLREAARPGMRNPFGTSASVAPLVAASRAVEALWTRVAAESLGPIHEEESGGSSLPRDHAQAFLECRPFPDPSNPADPSSLASAAHPDGAAAKSASSDRDEVSASGTWTSATKPTPGPEDDLL